MRTLLITGALGLAAGFALGGCLKTAAFNCNNDTQCSSGGTCEPEGLCSVASGSCSSGRAFDSSAGSKAGQCVGGDSPTDGPVIDDQVVDMGTTDMPIDQPQGCQAGYNTVVGGQTGHKYKLVTTKTDWASQHNAVCSTSGGYLVIPDDVAELTAVFGLDQGNNGDMWVGVQKPAGTVTDVFGNAYTALTVSGFNGGKKCAKTQDGTALVAAACGDSNIAACECEE